MQSTLEAGKQGARRNFHPAVVTCVRLMVTIGLMWFLFERLDKARFAEIFAGISSASCSLALAAQVATALPYVARWHLILASIGNSTGLLRLFKIFWIGLFFNQVLPTGIGGDAVRVWRLRHAGIPLGAAVRSIVLDRAIGFTSVVLLYAAGLSTLLGVVTEDVQRQLFIVVFAIAVCGLGAMLCMDRLPASLQRVKLIESCARLSREARQLFADPWRAAILLSLSLAGTGLVIATFERLGHSVGANLSFLDWTAIVPPLMLIQLIPVSIAGWGVREVTLVVMLTAFGVPADAALATSLLFGACQIVVALPGALVWLADSDAIPAREAPVPAGPIESSFPAPAVEQKV